MTDLEANLIGRVAVGDILRRSSHRYPHKIAVVQHRQGQEKSVRLSYEELNKLANRFAMALRQLGVGQGARVAAMCGNSVEFVIMLFGCAKGGYVLVPMNPMLRPDDAAVILNHADVTVLISDDVEKARELYRLMGRTRKKFFVIGTFPVNGISDGICPWEQFLDRGSQEEVDDVAIYDRDIYQIQYTSGATAIPKGVMTSHLAVVMASLNELVEMGTRSDAVVSIVLPMFHAGQQCQVFSTIMAGGTLVLVRGFEPCALLELIERERITKILLLPMMYRALLDSAELDYYDLTSLTTCVYGMAPMDQRTLQDGKTRLGAEFILGSGQTEAYPPSNVLPAWWTGVKSGNYWGVSTTLYDTAIMADDGVLLPNGDVGEIVWRSPMIMEGYFQDSKATEESRRFGWHHSGDLGYFDEDGLLVFVDRKKDMIKSGGENVSSLKIEQALLGHPGIQAVAVVGLPHAHWHEAVTAFVVPREDNAPEVHELLDALRHQLSPYEVPKAVIFVNQLPRTTTGKIQKHRLRELYHTYYRDHDSETGKTGHNGTASGRVTLASKDVDNDT